MEVKMDNNIVQNGKKYPVAQEVAKAVNQLRDAVRYRARLAGACWANRDQAARCEGDCVTCRYAGIPRVPEASMALYETMRIEHMCRTDTQMIYRCIDILLDMQAVDPDGFKIGIWTMAGHDQTAIARMLGIPLGTYRSRLARIGRLLREE